MPLFIFILRLTFCTCLQWHTGSGLNQIAFDVLTVPIGIRRKWRHVMIYVLSMYISLFLDPLWDCGRKRSGSAPAYLIYNLQITGKSGSLKQYKLLFHSSGASCAFCAVATCLESTKTERRSTGERRETLKKKKNEREKAGISWERGDKRAKWEKQKEWGDWETQNHQVREDWRYIARGSILGR